MKIPTQINNISNLIPIVAPQPEKDPKKVIKSQKRSVGLSAIYLIQYPFPLETKRSIMGEIQIIGIKNNETLVSLFISAFVKNDMLISKSKNVDTKNKKYSKKSE